jgi:hypothetical protein
LFGKVGNGYCEEMKQETNAKTRITDALAIIIPNCIIAMYYSVIFEFYRRNMLLLSIPSIICVLIVFWFAIKNKISLETVGTSNSWQQRLVIVAGFTIGYFLALTVINFLSYE